MHLPLNVIMDSGLGSDEEQRRTRTKEQKQRHNEQILNGGAHCFIDASALQDEDVSSTTVTGTAEQRKTDERRQGALLFKTSIPQYSTMFQLAGPSSDPPDTPFNSIVHIEPAPPEDGYELNGIAAGEEDGEEDERERTEEVAKHSLGFYVDLNEVEVETSPTVEANSSAKKNIFSMVIDFEAPKKEMPSRLLRRRSRPSSSGKKTDEAGGISKEVVAKNGNGDTQSEEVSSLEEEKLSGGDDKMSEKEPSLENESDPPDCSETKEKSISKTMETEEEEGPKFVRLSDLMKQNPRVEEICSDFSGGRMSRSIPESSWVESPLLMSRSAGYRIAPRPLEPDSTSLTDRSQTGASQRKLGTDLLRMFLEEIDTDTILHVGSPPRSIKAHRCILISRCQYFAGTLRGRSLIIDGFSYEAVHFALCHIYSGASHVPDSISLVELASLADMLSLEGLKEVVAHALKSRHCHHFHSPCAGCLTGVLEVLPLSAAYGLDDLYQRCLRWITSHYLRVWPSRAFASLPKELRDKCYQQHVIHMCAATVLETNLSCDRLLVSLPGLKWAEPVVQLGVQLAHICQTYVGQHYGAVLPTLLNMEPWNYPRIEEIMLNSTKGLSLDQECSAYSRCNSMIEKHKEDVSATLMEIFEKLKSHFEKRLILKANKLTKCPAWNKMDAKLKAHLKSLAKMDEGHMQRSFRNEPSRLPRMVSNRTGGTSSSESSRNSSPATSQAHASPSLRRSLLLAARAPQVPPSPSTVKRISTLTMPTAASAAKSAPARHIKQPVNMSTSMTKQRPATAPANQRRSTYANKAQPVKKETTRKDAVVKVAAVKVAADNKQRQVRRSNTVTKQQPVQINQNHVNIKNKAGGKQKEKEKSVVETTAAVMKSPCMQRSSTFLKEEPTVLTHPDQTEM